MVKNVSCDGVSMNYIVFGSGRKNLVIIPGMSIDPVTDSEDGIKNLYAPFLKDCTVYLFERTENMTKGYTVEKMADDTLTAITALKIKECSLIGVSQGGMIALLVAAKGGALVKKLVLASSLYKPNAVSKDTFSAWERYCNEGDGKALIEDFGRRVYSKPYAKKNNQALKKIEQNITENKLRRFGILSAAACVFDAGEQIKNITCPVFAICGENDAVLSSEGTREIVKALCCDCYIYENASHAVYDEKPDFIEKVCAFLFGSERFERNSKIKTKN